MKLLRNLQSNALTKSCTHNWIKMLNENVPNHHWHFESRIPSQFVNMTIMNQVQQCEVAIVSAENTSILFIWKSQAVQERTLNGMDNMVDLCCFQVPLNGNSVDFTMIIFHGFLLQIMFRICWPSISWKRIFLTRN